MGEVLDFQGPKRQRDEEKRLELQRKDHQEVLLEIERKEKEIVSAVLNIGDISSSAMVDMKDFLEEQCVNCKTYKEECGYRIDFPDISRAGLDRLMGFLKLKNIDFKIKNNKNFIK